MSAATEQTTDGHADLAVIDGLIIADDLTGAADSAVPFATVGMRTRVLFAVEGATHPAAHRSAGSGTQLLAVDTDSRRLDPATARRAVAAAVRRAPAARFRMKKIDSTLRGNVAAETMAALQALDCRLAICAPAFPAADRQTRDGRQWAAGRVVGDVAAGFTETPVTHVPLAAVRSGAMRALLDRAAGGGTRIVVADATTQDDLEAIVAAASDRDDVLWVGSGGLGAALAQAAKARTAVEPASVASPALAGPILTVVGSATSVAAAQARGVVESGAHEVAIPVSALIDGAAPGGPWAQQIGDALSDGRDVLLRISEGDSIVPGHGRAIVEALAAAVGPALRRALPAALVATGGETALAFGRALDACGLDVIAELEPGVVRSRLAGRFPLPVVTKAGAFGDPGTLARTIEILRPNRPEGHR